MKILLMKFRHIGDVLLSTALIGNLKAIYPESEIYVAVNEDSASIVRNNPDIFRVYSYPRKAVKSASVFRKAALEYRYMREILGEKYDMVINLTEGDRGAFYSLLSRAPRRFGYESKNPVLKLLPLYTNTMKRPTQIHTVEKDLAVLREIGKQIRHKKLRMTHSEADREFIEILLSEKGIESFILIHPVSRWMFKCWGDGNFAALIDRLSFRYGKKVIVTAAPDEKELEEVDRIMKRCRSEVLNLAGKLTLPRLSALIEKAELFIGVDTAPMHMAAAHDVPVIALFGPSNPVSWGPWENELQQACYEKRRGRQRCGKHTLITHGEGKIVMTKNGKVSTSMMSITVDEICEEIARIYVERR